METLNTILFLVQALVAVCLTALILIQHGKGAAAGAAFGSGASSTMFGSQGSSNFLTKATAILAIVFMLNSLTLAYIASELMQQQSVSVLDQAEEQVQPVDAAAVEKKEDEAETLIDLPEISE